jgi:hypothetical protein
MRRSALLLAVVAVLVLGRGEAKAQLQFGVQANIATDTDLGIGARLIFPVEQLLIGMEGVVSFDYYFPDNFDFWDLNGNLLVPVRISESFEPHLGGGLNLAFVSIDEDLVGPDYGDTELGLNLVGGFKFRTTSLRPFVEVRATIAGVEQLVFTGGFLVGGPR